MIGEPFEAVAEPPGGWAALDLEGFDPLDTLDTPDTPAAPRVVRQQLIAGAHLRQPPKPVDRVTGELPWWATAPRDGFTTAGAKATAVTANTKTARTIPVRMLEE